MILRPGTSTVKQESCIPGQFRSMAMQALWSGFSLSLSLARLYSRIAASNAFLGMVISLMCGSLHEMDSVKRLAGVFIKLNP